MAETTAGALSPDAAVTREELHTRHIEMRAFKRSDGLYEVEGHLLDTKPHHFKAPNGDKQIPANAPIHQMRIRLTYGFDMKIHEVWADTFDAPYTPCYDAPPTLQQLKGLSMARGWNSEIRRLFSGDKCCTHLMNMLGPMAAVAYQGLTVDRTKLPTAVDAHGKPLKIGSCYAYRTDREVVMKLWPKYYVGPGSQHHGHHGHHGHAASAAEAAPAATDGGKPAA